jgi:hypothetical protein
MRRRDGKNSSLALAVPRFQNPPDARSSYGLGIPITNELEPNARNVTLAAPLPSPAFCLARPAASRTRRTRARLPRGGKRMSAQRHRPSAPAPDRNAEARIQAAIVEWVRTVAPDVLIFAVPNGGRRSKAEAARLRWTGVVAGIPDLAVIAPSGKGSFPRSEVGDRSAIGGSARDHSRSGRLGSPFMTVTSIDDVRRAFSGWDIQTREFAR